MKRVLLAAAGAFLLSACADTTAPTKLRSVRGPSNDIDQNATIPSAFTGVNPCNGDVVPLTGTLHIHITSTVAESGNQHFYTDLTGQYSGTGAPSLVNYNAYTRQFDEFSTQDPFPIEETMISTYDVNSQTGIDNYSVTVETHVTINANSQPTADVQFIRSACKG